MTNLERMIMRNEGFRSKPYLCSAGKLTVGIGRNLDDKGIRKDEALYLLRNDINDCKRDLGRVFVDFSDLSLDRQHALIGMRFNLGPTGFRKFRKMIAAVRDGNFTLAAHEMMDSLWYTQVGKRGQRLRNMMLGVKDETK